MAEPHINETRTLIALGLDLAQQTEHLPPVDRAICLVQGLTTVLASVPHESRFDTMLAVLRLVVGNTLNAPAGSINVGFACTPPHQPPPERKD